MEYLYNNDCFMLMKTFIEKGLKVDLILTDPPYEVSVTNGGGSVNNVKKFKQTLTDINSKNIDKGYEIETFGDLVVQLMNNINIYFWCNKIQIPRYFDYWVGKHKCKFDILVWNKTNALPTYSNKYLTDCEYCLYFRKGGNLCRSQNYEDAKTIYTAPINHKDKKIYNHPTIKPLDLTEKLVRNSCPEGGLVLDPFMGSGTTGVACKKNNRNFIGIEIDNYYAKLAWERINNVESN